MLEYSPEKGLLGDILLGASPKPEWDIYLKQFGCPGNISTLCWWWGFLSPSGIHTEINQQQRTGNSRFAEPSSKLTCSLTPNSRNINLIQLVLTKWRQPHLCRCQPLPLPAPPTPAAPVNVLQWHQWKVSVWVGDSCYSVTWRDGVAQNSRSESHRQKQVALQWKTESNVLLPFHKKGGRQRVSIKLQMFLRSNI